MHSYRKLDPITTVDAETRFLQAAESLFFKGTFFALEACSAQLLNAFYPPCRLAAWLGPRDSGRDARLESPDGGLA